MVLSSQGNYEVISKKDLELLVPIEELDKRVAKLVDTDLAKATERQRQAVDYYRQPKRQW